MIRLLIVVFFMDICHGKIKSFSVSRLDNVSERCLEVGNYVALDCEIDDESLTIEIKRLQDGAILHQSRHGEKSLRHVIFGVSCSEMGTYECTRDHIERKTADLVIFKCPLQPCDGAGVQRTIFVEEKDKINVSLCVLACGNIDSQAMFNDTIVRRNKNSSSWYWDYEKVKSADLPTSRFHVHVRGPVEFGLLSVRIFSLHGPQYNLEFNIMLRPPGPPDCPTQVNITGRGHGSAQLSWRPGLDGGAKQSYAVYYSKDSVAWSKYRDGIEQTSETLLELDSDTTYYFRVVSRNQHSGQVDASTCNNTVVLLTSGAVSMSSDPVTSLSSPSQSIAWVAVAVGITIGVIFGVTVTVAVFLVLVFFQKRAQQSQAVPQDVVPNNEYEEVAGTQYESITQETPAMGDLDSAQYIQTEDVQCGRPDACIHSRRLISNVLKSDVKYANTVAPF